MSIENKVAEAIIKVAQQGIDDITPMVRGHWGPDVSSRCEDALAIATMDDTDSDDIERAADRLSLALDCAVGAFGLYPLPPVVEAWMQRVEPILAIADALAGNCLIEYVDGLSGSPIVALPAECVEDCSFPGEGDASVTGWRERVEWLADPETIRAMLVETGGWTDDDLADDAENQYRAIWVAACSVAEAPMDYGTRYPVAEGSQG